MSDSQSQALSAALGTYFTIVGIIIIASIVFSIIIYWRIFSKAGYSGALSLLMFVPIANLVMLCILAFGEWPIYQELNALRQQAAMMRGPQYPPQAPYPANPNGPQYPHYPENPQYRQG
ncbi:MAG: hypothetical protein NVS2B12_07480 [Ktedonobacteraceae bacterium]